MERLALADEALGRVRLYLRLATLWGWFSEGQYEHVATIQERLADFRPTIHPETHPHPMTEGIPFLDYTIFPYCR